MKPLLLLFCLLMCSSSCGKANAQQPITVETLQPPGFPDYTCFVLRNESGQAFGGNCTK